MDGFSLKPDTAAYLMNYESASLTTLCFIDCCWNDYLYYGKLLTFVGQIFYFLFTILSHPKLQEMMFSTEERFIARKIWDVIKKMGALHGYNEILDAFN